MDYFVVQSKYCEEDFFGNVYNIKSKRKKLKKNVQTEWGIGKSRYMILFVVATTYI